jgi:hypothetical protein
MTGFVWVTGHCMRRFVARTLLFLKGMFFLLALMFINMVVLGVSFCIMIIGNFPGDERREFAPILIGNRKYALHRFMIGVATSVLGMSWLVAKIYYYFAQPQTAASDWTTLTFNIVLPALASMGLLLAGWALLHQWKRNKAIFMGSSGFLVASALFSILLYRTVPRDGLVTVMYVVDAWTMIVGGAFTTSVFFTERLIRGYDERRPPERRVS